MANPYIAGSLAAASGSTTLVVPITVTTGDADSMMVGIMCTAGTISNVTDTQGNNYSLVDSDTTNTGTQIHTWAAYGASILTNGVDSVTVTYSSSSSARGAIVVGDPGVVGPDVQLANHGTSATASQATGTLVQAEEHIITFITDLNAGGLPAITNSTSLGSVHNGTNPFLIAAFKVTTTTGSTTPTGTITSTTWAITVTSNLVVPVTLQATPPDGILNTAYSSTLASVGGSGGYVYTLVSGTLPTGVTLSAGVLSGTPTVAGNYTFTLQSTDSVGAFSDQETYTVSIIGGASGTPSLTLPGNLLSAADANFETGVGTWVSNGNASSLASTTNIAAVGTHTLKWVATADGVSSVITGFYNIKALQGMIASGLIIAGRTLDCVISIAYYNSSNTFLSQVDSDTWTAQPAMWQPLTVPAYSPAGAAKFKLIITAGVASGTALPKAGDVLCVDMTYVAVSDAQVLVDWTYPAFSAAGQAGNAFLDVSMFTDLEIGLTMTHGRQDSISDIQPGNATFNLQNDSGWYSAENLNNIADTVSGVIDLHRRVQINLIDELGNWHVRFDGAISEIDYLGDNTGNTNVATVSVGDVLSFMNRQDSLNCWTQSQVLADIPFWHWPLSDSGNTGNAGIAAEVSGNGGPPLRSINTDASNTGTIAWQDTTGGVETLADAVKPGQSDGSIYWSQGFNQPTSSLRGLVSGAQGPFTSPSPSVYLVPKIAAQSGFNSYLGNVGYSLYGKIPPLTPTSAGADFTMEMWFTVDPLVLANDAVHVGPFVQLTLGNSKTQHNVCAGIFLNGTNTMTYTVKAYDVPPGFAQLNFSAAPTATAFAAATGVPFIPDAVPLPHHLVLKFVGDSVSPTCEGFLDNQSLGVINLHEGQNFDTLQIGSAWGGFGCHAGGIQLVSMYPYVLSGGQIIDHCMLGQYGMWEQTTDDCIAKIATYASIPGFWNNLIGEHVGLTLAEYQDITGNSGLTAMQLFEQGEMGLIYVAADGTLNFEGRDRRMGQASPDLLLAPDTFDADVGLSLVDQFLVNEQAVSSQLFQSGAAFVNLISQDTHGVYAQDPVGSPGTLPLITWSRAFGQMSSNGLLYWADPNLNDFAQWAANSRSEAWLIPGQLTIDMLAINPNTGLTVSQLYNLEINSCVAPSGPLPASWANTNLSSEWFVEGMTEVFSLTSRVLQLTCSAAEPQRAWKAGDATYGVLGTTSRIGISEADTNKVQAFGKDVAHDGGRPYWPNDFTNPDFLLGDAFSFEGGVANWTNAGNTALTSQTTAGGVVGTHSMRMRSLASGDMTAAHCTTGNISTQGYPCTPGQQINIDMWFKAGATPRTCKAQVTWFDITGTSISTTDAATITNSTSAWTEATNAVFAPAGAFWCRAVSKVLATAAINEDHFVDAVQIGGIPMNNPGGDDHDFIGGVDIRGLTDNLTLLLEPPIMVVAQRSNTQSVTGGAGLAQPQLFWDNVYMDTTGGMGAVPGWPNWYVCTVPGYYEIDGVINSAQSATGGVYWQGWIIVAKQAAQAVAAGTGNPTTVPQYICPIGETKRVHSSAQNASAAPSTRMYLGLGDMVTVGAETQATTNTGTGNGGSMFSVIFKGLSALDDNTQINGNLSVGGGVTTPTLPNPTTNTYENLATFSYYGGSAQNPHHRRNSNGNVYQGTYSGGGNTDGSQYSQVTFNTGQMISDLTGKTITSVTLSVHNIHFWYNSGGYVMIGVFYDGPGGSTWNPFTTPHKSINTHDIVDYKMKEGVRIDVPLPTSIISNFVTGVGGNNATGLWIGNASTTNLNYYGYFSGGPSSWHFTVNSE